MRFYVTVGIKRYELATPESMTFDEGLEVKRVSGGMDPFDVAARFGQMDPAAVLALLLVSMKREDPAVTEEDLRPLRFIEIVNTLEKEDDAVPPAVPPSGGSKNGEPIGGEGSSESLSGDLDDRSPSLETTHDPGGTPPTSAGIST